MSLSKIRKVRLLKNIRKAISKQSDGSGRPISFYGGLTTYLADGFLDSELMHAPYGYLTQR